MFETAELGHTISKKQFEQQVPRLRTELLKIQNQLHLDPRFSILVLISGVEGAGKGETVNVLHEWMDPRFLETHAFGRLSDEESERPDMWRFWRVLPPKGRVGIFFGSWYTRPILERVSGLIDDGQLEAHLARINDYERALAEDGTLVLKYWFHLSKKAQKKRLTTLSKDPKRSWRVTKRDWRMFKLYNRLLPVSERVVRETSTGEAPWTVVEGTDRRYREITVAEHLLKSVKAHRDRLRKRPTRAARSAQRRPRRGHTSILDAMDLGSKLEPAAYRKQSALLRGKLAQLSRRAQERGNPMICVFEGADAAGKGGAIRRVTRAMDARHYKVIPIAAPSDEEKARHYLWRFWRHLPRAGQLVIFDRSWYGRVLVERVEGFATPEEWKRSYKEINEFEQELAEFGYGIVKFWLHIDQNEQLRRFKAREKTAYKQYKITEEDWRNRKKWNLYDQAINEMVERTSTSFAPWTLVEANDKYFARVKVMSTVVEGLRDALKRKQKPRPLLKI